MAANTAKIVITADDKASEKLSSLGEKAKQMRVAFLAVAGVAAGAGIASVKFASDLDEAVNKANVTFGESAAVIKEFADTSAESFGLSAKAANEYTGTLGTILNASGLAENASADMSVELVKLAADLASFNNIPIDVALEKLRSGLVGEVEPLRTVGVLLNAASVEAEAFSEGIAEQGEELSEAQKVQARYSLILKQTTTQQGDFTRTSDSLANSTRVVRAQLEDAAATLGTQLLPAAQKTVGVMSNLVGQFSEMPSSAKTATLAAGGVAGGVAGIGLAIPPVITGIGLLRGALTLLAAHPIGAAIGVLAIALGGLILKMQSLDRESLQAASNGLSDLTESMNELQAAAGRSGRALSDSDAAIAALIDQASEMRDVVANAKDGLAQFNNVLRPEFVDSAREAIDKYNLTVADIKPILDDANLGLFHYNELMDLAGQNSARAADLIRESNERIVTSTRGSADAIVNAAQFRATNIIKQEQLEEDAKATVRDTAEKKHIAATIAHQDKMAALDQALADKRIEIQEETLAKEFNLYDTRQKGLEALAAGNKAAFEALRATVNLLPSVIPSGGVGTDSSGGDSVANAMRAFKESQNDVSAAADIANEELRRLEALTTVKDGEYKFVHPQDLIRLEAARAEAERLAKMMDSDKFKGTRLGQMVLDARGHVPGGAPPMLPGMEFDTSGTISAEEMRRSELLKANPGGITINFNADVYGMDDFDEKVVSALTNNANAAGAVQ